ncbi:branched-chain amino acid ABC transporter permease [Haloechinothrix sp. YIM 98757]|uniref:Branched-chain amino acid ABC transporter permease n=1 Tax=Haloechinothrix aidingensis TaxID=2752311 RepID=A0A838AA86_9PSEU|nr:branched-chain amino acid ABC transporter permease [Haloechinothrix aidingensis]MBA0126089.1 branched-chain amino acid ABC transporter permease [Haloechinothrix aidingensis]
MIDEIGAALVIGVLTGSVYSMVALGIVLVYRASRVFNFAQTEFGTTGLFAAFVAVELWGWHYAFGVLFGLAAAVAMGLATERLIIRPLRDSSRVTLLVGTAGVALAAIGIQFWQNNAQPIRQMPRMIEGVAGEPFGTPVTHQQVITLLVLLAVAVGLALFFRSPTGLAVQAAQQEATASELVGISVRRVSMLTWGIAAFLGGLAGVLSGPNLTFTAGFLTFGAGAALLQGFMAAVLAGMRSMPGAVLGGLVVGVVEQLGSLTLFDGVDGSRALFLFLFLLGVLLLRPQGVFVREKATV